MLIEIKFKFELNSVYYRKKLIVKLIIFINVCLFNKLWNSNIYILVKFVESYY